MTVPLSPRVNAQILDEAAGWLVEFSEGAVSNAAREEFSRWLKASPEHVRAYLQVSATFDDIGGLDKHRVDDTAALIKRARSESQSNIVPLPVASVAPPRTPSDTANVDLTFGADASWSMSAATSWPAAALVVDAATSENKERLRAPQIVRGGSLVRGLAAGIATLAICAGALAAWLITQRGMYSTGVGEQRIVNLTDGSTIELNADSRIRVRLLEHERLVELLNGQALFHVAKDPGRPFIVRSDSTSVRAVGTKFDVNREASDTIVTVLEGRVAVSRDDSAFADDSSAGNTGAATDDRPLYASAGEQVVVTRQNASKPVRPDVAAAIAWRERKLVFASSPLPDVISEYNRYHEKRLRVADSALETFKVSGVFSAADAASLVAFLRAQPNIEVDERESEIVLRSKPN